MGEFKREERYLVVKLSDFHTEQDEDAVRGWLRKFGVPTRQCVVVEHDWPIYEEVWDMVRRMAEGRAQRIDEMESRHALLRSACESVVRGLDFARDGEAMEREQDKLEVALKRDAGTACPDEGCPHYGTAHAHLDSRADPDEVSRAWRSSTIDPKDQLK